jgi:hypothetical protein
MGKDQSEDGYSMCPIVAVYIPGQGAWIADLVQWDILSLFNRIVMFLLFECHHAASNT